MHQRTARYTLLLSVAYFMLSARPANSLKALSENIRCEVHFFEAHFNYPPGYNKARDTWLMSEDMHKAFTRAPLSSYAYFKKMLSETWRLTMLKPLRLTYPFLQRFELTYLEARLTGLGQTLYRFEHKINHRKSVEFSLDALEPTGIFIQHAVTHDQYLHMTCTAE
ncbi:MAG: hypothetical protein JNJ69_09745 [Leptospiraceae bacterium]|nr:hypothetical protein [Leptospiraceae bacterium]